MAGAKKKETSIRIELKTILEIGGHRYLVLTDNLGRERMTISTRVFRDSEPVMSRRTDAPKLANPLDSLAIEDLVRAQHLKVTGEIEKKPLPRPDKGSHDFLEEARVHLRKRNNRKAYEVLRDAVELYPEDPHLLTYYGSLASIVGGRAKEGVDACRKAIRIVKERLPFGKEDVLPAFYINLARACMGGNDRQGAIEALFEGAPYDKKGGIIHAELVKFGVRRKPPISILPRSNPINKYIGIILYRKMGISKP